MRETSPDPSLTFSPCETSPLAFYHHIAWPLDALKKAGSHQMIWRQHKLAIRMHGDGVQIRDIETDTLVPVTRLYWFAWAAFHPDTEIQPSP